MAAFLKVSVCETAQSLLVSRIDVLFENMKSAI